MIKLHRCETASCRNLVGGKAQYCPNCRHQRMLASQRRYDARKREESPTEFPEVPKECESMHTLTADLRLMREKGFTSYGQLSTWRQQNGVMGG